MGRLIYFFAAVFSLLSTVNAQYYDNGQDPFSIDWKKIETPHFQVIFSDEIISEGKYYAAYLEEIYKTGGLTLQHNPDKIPVILHNQTAYSNGEVAWVPKRMNLYIVPPQEGYSESYAKHLALHEFRHVVQIDKLNQYSTKYLSYLFGEQAIGAVLGWHIPRWFFEGDAVAYETGASNAGRGRLPDFEMRLKAQVENFGVFSYPKAQFGSYKDFVPNNYDLGYQLIVRANQKYGDTIWSKTLNQIAKSPIHPNAFSKGIKKVSGLPERKLYATIMSDFKGELGENSTEKESKTYVNYYSPNFYKNGVVSYKTSFNKIPQIVYTNATGNEHTIITSGSIFDATFSMNDSSIVWNEYRSTRWENKSHSLIVKYDLISKKIDYLTADSKAYYSRISPDNKKILSVEVTNNLKWSLTIRKAQTGNLIESIPFDYGQPIQPSWSVDMRSIVFLHLNDKGKSLGILDLETSQIRWIVEDAFSEMSNPFFYKEAIFVKSVYNGVSNILKYDLVKNTWGAVTDEQYGVGEGKVQHDTLVYSKYTAMGYKLDTIPINNSVKPIHGPTINKTKQTDWLVQNELKVNFKNVDTSFNVQNYSRLRHLINIHSWAPLGINVQNIEVNPGATIMSQNALSTSTLVGGYSYNIADNTHKFYADYAYKGFYPILNMGVNNLYLSDSITNQNKQTYLIHWNEISFDLSATLPFNFDRGKWYRRAQTTVQYSYLSFNPSDKNEIEISSLKTNRLYYLGYFSNTLQTNYRALQPQWGQIARIKYMHSPFNMQHYGQLVSGELFFYLPGFMHNHGIKLYGAYQWKQNGLYGFTDQLIYPHGYYKQKNDKMMSYSVNYKFPFLYPDLNIAQLIYIKRLKMDVFYQLAQFQYQNSTSHISSSGLDFTSDLHFFRFPFPFELGVRYSRRINQKNNYFEFLYNMRF